MEYKEERDWKNVREYLEKKKVEYSIMEERIDVYVQRRFIAHLRNLQKKPREFKKKQSEAINNIPKLYNALNLTSEKRELLVVLSTLEDVTAYRAIESFQKQYTPLKKWATIALQQSRMLIQASLLEDKTVYVSTGLGGYGKLIRYFCVFIAKKGVKIQPYQHETLFKETEQAITQRGGKVEEHETGKKFDTYTILLPLDVDVKQVFENIVKECNNYGDFLEKNAMITNVRKFTMQEIEDIIFLTPRGLRALLNPTSEP